MKFYLLSFSWGAARGSCSRRTLYLCECRGNAGYKVQRNYMRGPYFGKWIVSFVKFHGKLISVFLTDAQRRYESSIELVRSSGTSVNNISFVCSTRSALAHFPFSVPFTSLESIIRCDEIEKCLWCYRDFVDKLVKGISEVYMCTYRFERCYAYFKLEGNDSFKWSVYATT